MLTSVVVPTVCLDGDLVPDDAVGTEVTLVLRSFADQENQITRTALLPDLGIKYVFLLTQGCKNYNKFFSNTCSK